MSYVGAFAAAPATPSLESRDTILNRAITDLHTHAVHDNHHSQSLVIDRSGNTLLHFCLNMNIEQAKYLIKEGQINSPNEFGSTPFLEACKGGNLLLVKFFLNCFPGCIADVDIFNQNALDKSVTSTNVNLFMFLVTLFPASHCHVNADKLIRIACKHGSLLVFRKIISMTNMKTDLINENLVHVATMNKNMTMIKELNKMTVNLDKPNSQGQTALFWACRLGHTKEAIYLIKNNANLYTSNSLVTSEWCLTPFYYACRNNIYKDLLWYLNIDVQRWEVTSSMILWARTIRVQYNTYMTFVTRRNSLPSDVNKCIAKYILPCYINRVLELACRPIQFL